MTDNWNEPTIESKVEYEGRIVTLRVDQVGLSGGRQSTREIVEHADSVCVVPLDVEQNVLLVRQYRKPLESQLLEVPAGGIEGDESPEATALRELQEEIGHTAREITPLSGFWLAPGWATEYMYAFLARDLEPSTLPADFDESIDVVPVPLTEVTSLIDSGEICDAKSIASLLLALRVVNAS